MNWNAISLHYFTLKSSATLRIKALCTLHYKKCLLIIYRAPKSTKSVAFQVGIRNLSNTEGSLYGGYVGLFL